METSAGFKILVADDEKASRMALEVPLRLSGYEVTTASGGAEAVAAARRQRFDLVLTDVYMPDLNGLEVLRAIREADPTTQVIVVTGLGSLDLALKAIEEGAYDLIAKPYPVEEMLTLVDRPLIQHAVDEAKRAGIEDFIFVTSSGKTLIEDHFDRQH
ncbi:MAG: response regulator, partial [Blastocatellia bacterium]